MKRNWQICLCLTTALALSGWGMFWFANRSPDTQGQMGKPEMVFLPSLSVTLGDEMPCVAAEKLVEQLLYLGRARCQLLTGVLDSVHDWESAEDAASRCSVLVAELAAVNLCLRQCHLNSAAAVRLRVLYHEFSQQFAGYAAARHRLLSLNPVAYGSEALRRSLSPFGAPDLVSKADDGLLADTCDFLAMVSAALAAACDEINEEGELSGVGDAEVYMMLPRAAALALRWQRFLVTSPDLMHQLRSLSPDEREALEQATQELVYLQHLQSEWGGSEELEEYCQIIARVIPPLQVVLENSWSTQPLRSVGRLRRMAALYETMTDSMMAVVDEGRSVGNVYRQLERACQEMLYLRLLERHLLNGDWGEARRMAELWQYRMRVFLNICEWFKMRVPDYGASPELRLLVEALCADVQVEQACYALKSETDEGEMRMMLRALEKMKKQDGIVEPVVDDE